MRLGLLSDTHIPEVVPDLPEEVIEALKGVELILHAGDVFSSLVLDTLEKIAPVLCARGDDDYYRLQDPRIKDVHNLNIEGISLGLVHSISYEIAPDHARPLWQKEESWQKMEAAIRSRLGLLPRVVVFGHTHHPVIEEHNDLYLVNPGSATFPDYKRKPGTVAILDITPFSFNARIIKLGLL